ncbi:MAG TPA: hypothetical protein VEU94_18480, partial [Terriglobales bacterium]|nr:hypothetical protein [Terriglobales bacterium]
MSLQRGPHERSTDLRESTLSADTPLVGCWTCGQLSDRRQTWFETSRSDTPPTREKMAHRLDLSKGKNRPIFATIHFGSG